MQRTVSKLTGYSIGAKDGDIGSVFSSRVERRIYEDLIWIHRDEARAVKIAVWIEVDPHAIDATRSESVADQPNRRAAI